MAAQADRGIPLSTLCPKFLHTNSTSHTWPFSAIAELIDNAYDPDVSAKHIWIDKTVFQGQECLSFMDNGNGLDLEAMHKMLSFGYSDKTASKGVQPIGMYGNGFKSGAMRLGKDAIIFSKSQSSSCVGMLSQTYLREIGAEQIIVPIVCFQQRETKELSVREEHKSSLQDILRYSPFKTQKELLIEFNAITPPWSNRKTGTQIIIWNLRSTSTRSTEFDFETDRYDIRIPSDVCEDMSNLSKHPGHKSHIPESVYSLRAYCSILYLKPRLQIIIRGQKVKSQFIAKSLAFIKKDSYSPTFLVSSHRRCFLCLVPLVLFGLEYGFVLRIYYPYFGTLFCVSISLLLIFPKMPFQNQRIRIIFGYNTKSKDQYGVMMYHKNRLIKAYEHVGCQLKTNYKGIGVIGVIECNFLDPTHNKQSFSETEKYRKTMYNLGIKLEDYWKEIQFRRKQENPDNSTPVEDTIKRPDQNWVQCDECSRWRKLPDGIDCSKLPDTWSCRINPDPQFRNCQVEEEPEDSDEEPAAYSKTFKKQEREDKKKKEAQRQKEADDQKRQEQQRLANLARENQSLKQQQERLKRQLCRANLTSPLTTPRSGERGATARASILSQADCSPSSDSGLPVISEVWSTSPLMGKRPQPVTPQRTPKRPRVNGFCRGTLVTSTSADPQSSPSVSAGNDDSDTDDDISILEKGSTPKSQKPGFDLTKVKTEQEQSDANVSMLLDCTDAAAPVVASETDIAGMGSAGSAAAGTSPSPAPPQQVADSSTQTIRFKEEGEGQYQSEEEERAGQSTSDGTSSVDIDVCNKVTRHLDNEEDAGPSCAKACDKTSSPLHYPGMFEVQEQQDQLLELMQATAQERDSFKEQVNQLSCQLQDMQIRLQELSQINVKRKCSHQGSQTEETGARKEFKSLLENIKQKLHESIEDKEGLLAATEASSSTAQGEEKDAADIALHVDRLLRDLDQKNKEKDELHSQLDSLEDEKANLVSECEHLRTSLQQRRENAHTATNSSAHTDPEEAEGTADSGSGSSSDTSRSLIELRHNIGRLLISFVPALDLGQVNYECNVIDEILEQVLSSMGSITLEGLMDSAQNN